MKAKDVIKRLEAEGWWEARQEGAHKQFKHPDKPGRVTVPAHGSKDIPKGTLASISRQAGWNKPTPEAEPKAEDGEDA